MKKSKNIFLLMILILIYSHSAFSIDALLITSTDLNIIDKWTKTESEAIPNFSTVSSVVKKQYFSTLLFFTDYKLDSNQNVKISCDIKVISPDKRICFEQKNIQAFNRTVKKGRLVLLSDAILKICFENSDSLGSYTIETISHDIISGTSISKSKNIELVDFKSNDYFHSDEEFQEWFHNYHKNPSPEKAISGYLYYARSKLNEAKNGFIPVFTFFLTIFNHNQFLIPILKDSYSKQDLKTKIYIIWLLRYLDYDSSDFLESLKGDEKQVFEKIKNEAIPLQKDKIVSGEHLDVQWSTFLATGSFEPIKKIIDTLEYSKYSGSLEAYKTSEKTEQDREKAILDSTFQAARWSISSNIQQYELVKKYCIYSFINDEYPKDVKLWLGVILSKQVPERFKMVKSEDGAWEIKY